MQEQEELSPERILDGIQFALDVAGFVPGLGAILDLFKAAIYAARGDKLNAGLSLLAVVPAIGDAAAAKIASKGVKAAKIVKSKPQRGQVSLTDNFQSGKKVDAEPYNREALRRNRVKMAGFDSDAPCDSKILYDTVPK